MSKLIPPIVLTIVISAVLIVFVVPNVNLTPMIASTEAQVVDDLLTLELQMIAAVFTLCMVFLLYSVFVHRRKEGDTEDAEPNHGNTPLEIAWTLVPTVFVVWFAIYGIGIFNDITSTDNIDMEVRVVASQWNWRFDYPDVGPSGHSSTDLVLPVGAKVHFTIVSEDVIHSFWVPEFRLKQDAVPGIETELIITPSEVGEYKVRCAEICGLRHAYMLATVRVLTQNDFDAWKRDITIPLDDPIERAKIYATNYGCAACHSTSGEDVVGPTWLGLFGSTETLDDGSMVEVDEAYLLESILDPDAKVVDGFSSGVMPGDFEDKLTDEEIDDLITYIMSLSE